MMVTKVDGGVPRTAFWGAAVFEEVGISMKDIEDEMHRNPAWAAAKNEWKSSSTRSCSLTRSSHA